MPADIDMPMEVHPETQNCIIALFREIKRGNHIRLSYLFLWVLSPGKNWNLEMLLFCGGSKTGEPRGQPSSGAIRPQLTRDAGLFTLRHPCSPQVKLGQYPHILSFL